MSAGHNTLLFSYKNPGGIYSNVVLIYGLDLNSNMNIQTNYFHSKGLYGLRNSVLVAKSSSYDYAVLYSSSADMGDLGENSFMFVENSFVKNSGGLTGKIYGSYGSVDHKGPITGNGEIEVNNLGSVANFKNGRFFHVRAYARRN